MKIKNTSLLAAGLLFVGLAANAQVVRPKIDYSALTPGLWQVYSSGQYSSIQGVKPFQGNQKICVDQKDIDKVTEGFFSGAQQCPFVYFKMENGVIAYKSQCNVSMGADGKGKINDPNVKMQLENGETGQGRYMSGQSFFLRSHRVMGAGNSKVEMLAQVKGERLGSCVKKDNAQGY
jgi:hypothetical protein